MSQFLKLLFLTRSLHRVATGHHRWFFVQFPQCGMWVSLLSCVKRSSIWRAWRFGPRNTPNRRACGGAGTENPVCIAGFTFGLTFSGWVSWRSLVRMEVSWLVSESWVSPENLAPSEHWKLSVDFSLNKRLLWVMSADIMNFVSSPMGTAHWWWGYFFRRDRRMCNTRQVELAIARFVLALTHQGPHLPKTHCWFSTTIRISDTKKDSRSTPNTPQLALFWTFSLCTCPKSSLRSPDLTFCSTCSLCLGTYQPIKFPSTLHEWMPFSVMWIHGSPDGRGDKQPWQLLDVILMDFEWWSFTEETPCSTTPSQEPEHGRWPADQGRVIPTHSGLWGLLQGD